MFINKSSTFEQQMKLQMILLAMVLAEEIETTDNGVSSSYEDKMAEFNALGDSGEVSDSQDGLEESLDYCEGDDCEAQEDSHTEEECEDGVDCEAAEDQYTEEECEEGVDCEAAEDQYTEEECEEGVECEETLYNDTLNNETEVDQEDWDTESNDAQEHTQYGDDGSDGLPYDLEAEESSPNAADYDEDCEEIDGQFYEPLPADEPIDEPVEEPEEECEEEIEANDPIYPSSDPIASTPQTEEYPTMYPNPPVYLPEEQYPSEQPIGQYPPTTYPDQTSGQYPEDTEEYPEENQVDTEQYTEEYPEENQVDTEQYTEEYPEENQVDAEDCPEEYPEENQVNGEEYTEEYDLNTPYTLPEEENNQEYEPEEYEQEYEKPEEYKEESPEYEEEQVNPIQTNDYTPYTPQTDTVEVADSPSDTFEESFEPKVNGVSTPTNDYYTESQVDPIPIKQEEEFPSVEDTSTTISPPIGQPDMEEQFSDIPSDTIDTIDTIDIPSSEPEAEPISEVEPEFPQVDMEETPSADCTETPSVDGVHALEPQVPSSEPEEEPINDYSSASTLSSILAIAFIHYF